MFLFGHGSRPASRTAKIRGIHVALVADSKDAPPDNPGYRVRVTLPTLATDEQTFYARIAVPMSGKGRGTYFLPELHDQVLVVFEHGDINRPIIVGTLSSKKQQPVEVNGSGKNNTKLIKSRSGHRIIFDDTKGAEKITIVDRTKANKIVLDAATKAVRIESAGDIVVKASANVILHANALKIGVAETVLLKAKNVLAHAQSTLGINAASEIVVTGSQVQMNVVNSPACSVSGTGTGELGGVSENEAKPQVPPNDEAAHADAGGSAGGTGGGVFAPAEWSTPVLPPIEPKPVLVSAAWSTDRTTVSTSVELTALAVDMNGKNATFTITDADDPSAVITTLSGTCDEHGVRTTWTTPTDGTPARFVFEVAADGKTARSGVLILVRKFEATLLLGDEPAANVEVRLRVEPGGDEFHATADDDGIVRFPDVPFGDVTLSLEGP